MTLSLIALFVFIFGAYAYGALFVLSLRHASPATAKPTESEAPTSPVPAPNLFMFAVCTLWFILQSAIQFRVVLGASRGTGAIELAALVLVFSFPGLVFHMFLTEPQAGCEAAPSTRGQRAVARASTGVLIALYVAGAAMAVFLMAVILGWMRLPARSGAFAGISLGALFTVSSVACLAVMGARARSSATRDERRLRAWMRGLLVALIAVFFVLTFMREWQVLINLLEVLVRMTPLAFLLVAVYFESRVEFYDLIVKRGVLLLLTLVLLGGGLAISLHWLDLMPEGAARAWLLAVVLLPVAMVLPWLHDRAGRLLDRLWFGREFTPVEAVKHALASMQQATDEPSLCAAAEATLSEMFRRRILIVPDDRPLPEGGTVIGLASSGGPNPVRIATIPEPGTRALLSEDRALLRSLASVFGYMLENVRLQRKRQEQEQVAQELRLQTSRSELKALRAQINPHFLFNALNAIASLIHTDPARADAAVEQLAEVFRYTLRRSEHEWAPLDQELALARAYLEVEQARFGKRLGYSIYADPALHGVPVPSMLLQTLVENAVKHGISQIRTPGRIDVRATGAGDRLTLEVRDTGPGFDDARRPPRHEGESFGLRSIRDRLAGYFDSRGAIELVREGGVTIARIRMPLVADANAKFKVRSSKFSDPVSHLETQPETQLRNSIRNSQL